ncbi:energy transducer TonB [Flavihumibacter sp. RY-1]|uniref:Energy transducer TonB n=1 Tax=Flavihumibacter fluminis TaxID=2909236 RepID=A0ABS9BMB1_9BACT|nr:energy transducer TonB [Flavihumibacter fluminis]MCF1716821.1 energy transducer TonB [Flavihumibacter fluminis]
MKYNLVVLFLVLAKSLTAQDTTYYDIEGKKVSGPDSANSYAVVTYAKDDSSASSVKSFTMQHRLEAEIEFSDFKKNIQDGWFKSYWPDGKLRRKEKYQQGVFLEGFCYTATGADTSFFPYKKEPEYPGGLVELKAFLQRELKFPKQAIREGVQGTVRVLFKVRKDGSLTNISIQKSIHPALDQEALRIVRKMKNWVPGLRENEPSDFWYVLPVVFRFG